MIRDARYVEGEKKIFARVLHRKGRERRSNGKKTISTRIRWNNCNRKVLIASIRYIKHIRAINIEKWNKLCFIERTAIFIDGSERARGEREKRKEKREKRKEKKGKIEIEEKESKLVDKISKGRSFSHCQSETRLDIFAVIHIAKCLYIPLRAKTTEDVQRMA